MECSYGVVDECSIDYGLDDEVTDKRCEAAAAHFVDDVLTFVPFFFTSIEVGGFDDGVVGVV